MTLRVLLLKYFPARGSYAPQPKPSDLVRASTPEARAAARIKRGIELDREREVWAMLERDWTSDEGRAERARMWRTNRQLQRAQLVLLAVSFAALGASFVFDGSARDLARAVFLIGVFVVGTLGCFVRTR